MSLLSWRQFLIQSQGSCGSSGPGSPKRVCCWCYPQAVSPGPAIPRAGPVVTALLCPRGTHELSDPHGGRPPAHPSARPCPGVPAPRPPQNTAPIGQRTSVSTHKMPPVLFHEPSESSLWGQPPVLERRLLLSAPPALLTCPGDPPGSWAPCCLLASQGPCP